MIPHHFSFFTPLIFIILWFSFYGFHLFYITSFFTNTQHHRLDRWMKVSFNLFCLGTFIINHWAKQLHQRFDDPRENQRNKLKRNKELSGNNISKKNALMDWKFKRSRWKAAEYFLLGLFIRANSWWSMLEILSHLKRQKSETKNIQRILISMGVSCIILFTWKPNGVSMLLLNRENTDGF